MKQGRLVRLPQHAHVLVTRWRRAASALQERLGREPTESEVGAALGLSARKQRLAAEAVRAAGLARHDEDEEGGSRLSEAGDCGRLPEELAAESEASALVRAGL